MPVRTLQRSPARRFFPTLFPHWFKVILLPAFPALLVILSQAGKWLITEDQFEHVSWAVVLDGESRECERTDEAAKLYREQRVDSLILSGVRLFKTRYRSEFILPRLLAQGVDPNRLFEFRNDSYSTIEEAALLLSQVRLLGIDTLLVITSDFHTSRTKMIYRKLSQGSPVVLVHPAGYREFIPGRWWASRNSLKIFLLEWTKTFQSFLEVTWKYGGENRIPEARYLILEPQEPLWGRLPAELFIGMPDFAGEKESSPERSTSSPHNIEPASAEDSTGGSGEHNPPPN